MGHTHIKLPWILKFPGEPLLIDFHKLFNTIKKFICVKQRHVDVVGGIQELSKMMVRFECLCFTRFRILNNIETFVARNAVVKRGGCDWNRHGAVRNNLWFLPSGLFGPIHHQHMVSVSLSKYEILGIRRLNLLHISLRYFNILCIESTKLFGLFLDNGSFRLNLGCESSSNKSSSKHFNLI